MVNKIDGIPSKLKEKIPFKIQFRASKKNMAIMLAFLALSILLASIYFQNNIIAGLDKLKLIPQAEGFTELYFENYAEISHLAPRAGDKMPISFVINNFEGTEKNYSYVIYFQNDEKKFLIDKGTVILQDQQGVNIQKSYLFRSSYPQGQIVIELKDLNQEIRFLLG